MKRFVFIAVALLAFWGAAAQQPSTMKFTADEWDFGTIKEEGGKVSHRFEFTNSGPNPFVIQKVETSCGCTTPTFTREPVLPGRKGYVEITYDPLYRPGSFRREVTVTSNDRKNINKLIIRGNVIATPRTPQQEFPVEVGGGLMASRTTVGVGYLARGTSQAGTLEYYNDSKNSVTLGVEYESPAIPGFSVSFSSPVLQPGARGVMTLTFDLRSAVLWGRLSGGFYLTVNGRKMPVRFTATGIAVEDFSNLTPEQFNQGVRADFTAQYYHFGDVRAGEEKTKNFTVTNTGRLPLVVRYVHPDEHMSVTLKQGAVIRPGGSVTFSGTLRTEGARPGRFMGTTVIILNDPQRPMRELRLTGNVI